MIFIPITMEIILSSVETIISMDTSFETIKIVICLMFAKDIVVLSNELSNRFP